MCFFCLFFVFPHDISAVGWWRVNLEIPQGTVTSLVIALLCCTGTPSAPVGSRRHVHRVQCYPVWIAGIRKLDSCTSPQRVFACIPWDTDTEILLPVLVLAWTKLTQSISELSCRPIILYNPFICVHYVPSLPIPKAFVAPPQRVISINV